MQLYPFGQRGSFFLALFVTKWIHTVECEATLFPPDAEEERLFAQLKSHLAEMEVEHEDSKSLAACLAKAWSSFLNDVSVDHFQ
jgi:hemerythrin-like domain-containing protein